MAQPSRTAQIAKIHKVLKKYYKPVNPEPSRSVIEYLLFACCLENAPYEATEEAFAALSHNFFDWNEVRVSTVRELAEEMPRLPDPSAAAQRVKRVLQSIFDATYAFDLEELRKLNLGQATEKLAKFDGTTLFSTAYVVQAALGGHSIPIDQGVIKALEAADMITPEEVQSGQINGLERAIVKPKGFEFASLLHQLGADFIANPHAPALMQILVDLNPAAAERMTKRRSKKERVAEPQPAVQGNGAADETPLPQADSAEGESEGKKKRSEARKKAAEKPAPPSQHQPKPAEPKAAEAKHHEPKHAEAKVAEAKRTEPKRTVGQAAADKDTQAKAHTPKAIKAQTSETKPDNVGAQVRAAQSKPAEAKAKPAEVKAKPAEAKIKPAETKAKSGETKVAASKAPTAKAAEAASGEPPSSNAHEPRPAPSSVTESPASAKRKPATSRKETPAKKDSPAVESKGL
jgi:hypothetical protein